MCGIAGIWGEANDDLIRRMTDRIAHRGPDNSGVLVVPDGGYPVSLGHRRLSVIDLSPAGHQPMSNEEGTVWTVYNGEIYNFQELRAQLMERGHVFKSRADTEVLVHGYEEWGIEMVRRLNGIFAFAIWDREAAALHLARDRYGVKPLYYSEANGRLLFGSETKALLCDGRIGRELDPDALLAYLRFRYCPEPLCLFAAVKKVAPGEVLSWRRGERGSRWSYYELSYSWGDDGSTTEALAEELRATLREAVKRQMVADVPVGLFLSGGVDSSGLLALARQFHSEPLKTFTIGFRKEDQRYEAQPDDVGYARGLARQYGTDHEEIVLEPRIVELLPKVIWHLDDPVADPAAITSYLICGAARERGTKVLLSGQGGDEVFGGYPWHLACHLSRSYQRLPGAVRRWLECGTRLLPGGRGGRVAATARRLRKFAASASLGFDDRLVGLLSYATKADLLGLAGSRHRERIEAAAEERVHRALLWRGRGEHPVNRMLHLDMGTFLPSLNLMYTDKTSMAFGVEVRVPYVDHAVVDFMAGMAPGLKLRGTTRKYLMKRALRGLVPDAVLKRRKGGFGAPIRRWIVRDLRGMIGDLLSEERLRRRGFFDPGYVAGVLGENASGRHDYSYLIYILLSFELWCGEYLDAR